MEITPQRKTHWMVLIPLSLFLLYNFIQLNMMASAGPFILKMIPVTLTELGLISSLFFYINLILIFPVGIWLDRYSAKWLVIISLIIAIIGMVICAVNPSLCNIIIWRSFAGVAGAFSYLSCVKMLSTYYPRHCQGLFLGLTGIVIMVSGIIAQFPLIFLLRWLGFTHVLWVDGVLGVLVIISLIILIPNKIEFPPNITAISNRSVYLCKENWLIAVYACLINLPLFILGAVWGNLYLQHVNGLTLQEASFMTSLIFVGHILGAPVLGSISDKMGSRKLLMLVSSLIFLISIILIIFSKSFNIENHLNIILFLLGVSTGGQALAYASIVDINSQKNIAKATSLLSFLAVGSGAVAQPLFGWIVEFSHPAKYQNGMYIFFFAALAAVLIALVRITSGKITQGSLKGVQDFLQIKADV